MSAKTVVPLVLLGALLLAGCTKPQESSNNTSTTTCPSDLDNSTTTTYGATDESGGSDACADMKAPTPGATTNTTAGNETNATNASV